MKTTTRTLKSEGGLLVASVQPGQCAGYILNFDGHGAFDPAGRVQLQNGSLRDLLPSEIEEHNQILAQAELATIKAQGRGVLYLFHDTSGHSVGTWASKPADRLRVTWHIYSVNNWGVRRMDVWFWMDGARWHGVNLGDNDLVRVKRRKQ